MSAMEQTSVVVEKVTKHALLLKAPDGDRLAWYKKKWIDDGAGAYEEGDNLAVQADMFDKQAKSYERNQEEFERMKAYKNTPQTLGAIYKKTDLAIGLRAMLIHQTTGDRTHRTAYFPLAWMEEGTTTLMGWKIAKKADELITKLREAGEAQDGSYLILMAGQEFLVK